MTMKLLPAFVFETEPRMSMAKNSNGPPIGNCFEGAAASNDVDIIYMLDNVGI